VDFLSAKTTSAKITLAARIAAADQGDAVAEVPLSARAGLT
jgi:hypothetical protein